MSSPEWTGAYNAKPDRVAPPGAPHPAPAPHPSSTPALLLAIGVNSPHGLVSRSEIAILTLSPDAALGYLRAVATGARVLPADVRHEVRFFSFPEGNWDPQHLVRDLLENGTVLEYSGCDDPGVPVPVTAVRACVHPDGICFQATELVGCCAPITTYTVPKDEFERAAAPSRG